MSERPTFITLGEAAQRVVGQLSESVRSGSSSMHARYRRSRVIVPPPPVSSTPSPAMQRAYAAIDEGMRRITVSRAKAHARRLLRHEPVLMEITRRVAFDPDIAGGIALCREIRDGLTSRHIGSASDVLGTLIVLRFRRRVLSKLGAR